MLAATTWKDVAIELVKQLAAIIGAMAALVWAFRRYVKPKIDQLAAKQDVSLANQARLEAKANVIEEKADGNHAKALEAIKLAGKYEGHAEAKNDSRFDQEQILKAVEQVLAAQSKQRGRRRSDPP